MSQQDIADSTNNNLKTVVKSLKKLRDKGYIDYITKPNTVTTYTITPKAKAAIEGDEEETQPSPTKVHLLIIQTQDGRKRWRAVPFSYVLF